MFYQTLPECIALSAAGAKMPVREKLSEASRASPPGCGATTDVLAFVDWLYHFNQEVAGQERMGFYGLDLYRLHASIRAVLD